MRPIIGIIVREDINNKRNFNLNKEICAFLSRFGATPIGIYPDVKQIDDVFSICDGFILPGGDDFSNYDIECIKKIADLDKPLLGICLGMQSMAIAYGGSVNKISNLNHKQPDKMYVHSINILNNTRLHNILKKEKIDVNSRHFDYVSNPNLVISATSDDNIIEAIEMPSKKFFIGVQWHPETLIDDSNSISLFKEFINSCRGGMK